MVGVLRRVNKCSPKSSWKHPSRPQPRTRGRQSQRVRAYPQPGARLSAAHGRPGAMDAFELAASLRCERSDVWPGGAAFLIPI